MTVTTVSMRLKFPELSGETDAAVQNSIDEASRNVDDTWFPGDQDLALLYLAAHYLMISMQRRESGTGQQVSAERIGEMSWTYVSPDKPNPEDLDISSTSYGRRYLELARLNFFPVAVI